jgi:hypothetical protein
MGQDCSAGGWWQTRMMTKVTMLMMMMMKEKEKGKERSIRTPLSFPAPRQSVGGAGWTC